MLLCSQNKKHAYKDFWANHVSFALLVALKSIYLEPKTWPLAITKGNNLNQETFYLDKDEIEFTHKYTHIRIEFFLHVNFEPSSKKRRMASMKALMGTLRREAVVIFTLGTQIPYV